jgi:hypothetical protein
MPSDSARTNCGRRCHGDAAAGKAVLVHRTAGQRLRRGDATSVAVASRCRARGASNSRPSARPALNSLSRDPILAPLTSGNASPGSSDLALSPASSNGQTRRRIQLPSDDLIIEVRAGLGEALGHRMDVDLHRQRAAVLVAELRGDVGRRHAGCGQEAGCRVAEGVDVHGPGEAVLLYGMVRDVGAAVVGAAVVAGTVVVVSGTVVCGTVVAVPGGAVVGGEPGHVGTVVGAA